MVPPPGRIFPKSVPLIIPQPVPLIIPQPVLLIVPLDAIVVSRSLLCYDEAMEKTVMYLAYFMIYSVLLLIIGKSSLHGPVTEEDYFICGKQVSLPACVCTFSGTWISAITVLSLTGSVYENGISVVLYSVAPWFLGGFLLAFISGRIWEGRAVTVPEYFRLRFGGRELQLLYGLVFLFVYLFYLVTQYKGFGMVASELFEIPYPVAVLLVFLFILYTTIGGYRSVLRSDAFNLVLLFASLLILSAALIRETGGFAVLYQRAESIQGAAYENAAYFTEKGEMLSLFGNRYTPLVSFSMFWGWGLGLSANPQYLVRVMSANSRKTAVRTVLVSLLLLAMIYFFLIHIGLAMRVLVPELSGAQTTDGIFIRLINHELYGPWSALFFFSVIGSCISTANSQLLMIASAVAYDILHALEPKWLNERRVVRLGRAAVVAAGALAMLLTLNPPDFTLSFGGDLWGIIAILVFPPLYGSLLTSRVTLRGIRAAFIAGALYILVSYPLFYAGIFSWHPAMAGVPLTTAALFFFSRNDMGAETERGTEEAEADRETAAEDTGIGTAAKHDK